MAEPQPQAAEGWTPHDMVHGTVYPAHDARQPRSGWCGFSTSTWMTWSAACGKRVADLKTCSYHSHVGCQNYLYLLT